MYLQYRLEAEVTLENQPAETQKNIFQNPKFRRGLFRFLLFLITFLLIQNALKEKPKSDFELMQEVSDNRAKWASIEHASAVLRLCQSGNEQACELLKKSPKMFDLPYISNLRYNRTFVELYEMNVVSKKIYKLVKEKFPDLKSFFEAGKTGVEKEVGRLSEPLLYEIKRLLLEHGFDPTDWFER